MTTSLFRSERDSDGIVTLTLDVADRSMNLLTLEFVGELAEWVEKIARDPAVTGVLVTSAKRDFVAGADIHELADFHGGGTTAQGYERSAVMSRLLRRMETCGKPFAAAINGPALGGGFELCLACHYRVLSDDPRAVVGLPEVTLGLLPGAGGTQRLPRLVGIAQAVPLLIEGRRLVPVEAVKLGLVHETAHGERVVARARAWLASQPDAVQPWDRKGFRIPGGAGASDPGIAQLFAQEAARISAQTQHNYPAPLAILSCVFEGSILPMERALHIESKYFAQLLTGAVSRNLMRTLFINKGLADKLARRPSGPPPSSVRKLGVLGAGMMGSGIAYAAAKAGIEVTMLDTTAELATRGRADSERILQREIERGRVPRETAESMLERIRTTVQFEDLAGCELVIEAVYEQRDIKARVTQAAELQLPGSAIFASNTSTLPITGLAQASARPQQFIGLHFFSPVEKMPLVEVIVGVKTSPATTARALDFVRQLRKTPIVVNDSRGFYTSRVFGTFVHEGIRLLQEGVAPALIENAARLAGMAVGPLAVSDEVSIELLWKVIRQGEEDQGSQYIKPPGYATVQRFVQELQRLGKRNGAGFYEYPAGRRKYLWPGLSQLYPPRAVQPEVAEVKRRLLYIQALESARCLEEGVLTHPADADLGAILGWGFPTWTGGTLSLIDTVGPATFVEECDRFAAVCGERFQVPAALRAQAQRNATFYGAAASGRVA